MATRSLPRRILPLFDRVLVQRVKAQDRTASGLYIPEKSLETLNEGVVLAVGPEVKDKDGKPILKEGDKVILPGFGGQNVKMGSEEMLLFAQKDILAKLQE